MTNVYRRHYDPTELDAPTGDVPTWGNPGALISTSDQPDGYANRDCRAHGVRWRGDDDCWLCKEEK